MAMEGPAQRVCVYLSEADVWHGKPLARAIVLKAREMGLSGATVAKGIGGYGPHRVLHRAALIETEADLPVIVELVDRAERIAAFLPVLDEMMREGLVTVEDVRVVHYRPRPGASPEDPPGPA